MKIIALANVEVAGYGIVKRGEIIDFSSEKVDERIAANFLNAADDSRLKAAKRDKDQPELIGMTKEEMLAQQDAERKATRKSLIDNLGVDGLKERLAELKVPFNKDMKPEKLADLYLDHLGE